MAISIDTVYQKVLTLANKEQRGYITPQEFNLFADMAQKEIFEQYFYDVNQWTRQHGNEDGYSDMRSNLQEKLSLFEYTAGKDNITVKNEWGDISLEADIPNLYRLGAVFIKYPENIGYEEAELVDDMRELRLLGRSKLTKNSRKRPLYLRYFNGYDRIKVYPYPVNDDGSQILSPTVTNVRIDYMNKPTKPNWGYIVVNEKALYNSSASVNFQLHPAEESELVYKILKFAGISLQKQDITQAGQGLESTQISQEKK